MRKQKEVKQIEFNSLLYDYLTKDTPLEGWVWEFMRRSQEYRDAYESIQFVNSGENITCQKCNELIGNYIDKFRPYSGIDPNEKWSDNLAERIKPWVGQPSLDKTNPVIVVNMKKGTGVTKVAPPRKFVEVEFNKVKKQESTIEQEVKTWQGNYGERVTYIIDGPHSTERREMKNVWQIIHAPDGIERREPAYEGGDYIHIDHPLELVFRNQGRENVLMALVDLSAPGKVEELISGISREIRSWKKKLGLKQRKPKIARKEANKNKVIGTAPLWKSYLIVYDLKEKLTYTEIGKILRKVDSKYRRNYKSSYGAEKYVERHKQRATDLVNGGYRKYLS